MRGNGIDLFEIDWSDEDIERVAASIKRGSQWANGPAIDEFEAGIEDYLGTEEAVAVNSGTSALVCALIAHGIGPGDEVIVPSFTFIATANAVELTGATPVFADIEPDTYGLNPQSVEDMLGPKTAAVVPVHCYGGVCKIDEIVAVAEEHDIAVIEDAAESFGARYGGRQVGTFGDSAALSFCQNKIITTGEGGAVITDNQDVAAGAEMFRSHGRASGDYFYSDDSGRYVDIGANLRMSDLAASLGNAQLQRVEKLIEGRRRAARRMNARFNELAQVQPHTIDEGRHVYQLYTVTFDEDVNRNSVVDVLAERGIDSKPYWDTPVHLTEYYRQEYGHRPGELPITEDIAKRVLSLPMHPNLTDEEIDSIVAAVAEGIDRSSAMESR